MNCKKKINKNCKSYPLGCMDPTPNRSLYFKMDFRPNGTSNQDLTTDVRVQVKKGRRYQDT
jgi:hypothetical protein